MDWILQVERHSTNGESYHECYVWLQDQCSNFFSIGICKIYDPNGEILVTKIAEELNLPTVCRLLALYRSKGLGS